MTADQLIMQILFPKRLNRLLVYGIGIAVVLWELTGGRWL